MTSPITTPREFSSTPPQAAVSPGTPTTAMRDGGQVKLLHGTNLWAVISAHIFTGGSLISKGELARRGILCEWGEAVRFGRADNPGDNDKYVSVADATYNCFGGASKATNYALEACKPFRDGNENQRGACKQLADKVHRQLITYGNQDGSNMTFIPTHKTLEKLIQSPCLIEGTGVKEKELVGMVSRCFLESERLFEKFNISMIRVEKENVALAKALLAGSNIRVEEGSFDFSEETPLKPRGNLDLSPPISTLREIPTLSLDGENTANPLGSPFLNEPNWDD